MLLNWKWSVGLAVCAAVVITSAGWLFLRHKTSDGFRCPENYADQAEYVDDLAKYISMREKQTPGLSLDEIMAERKTLMEQHECKGVPLQDLKKILDDSPLASDSASLVSKSSARIIGPDARSISLVGSSFGPYDVTRDSDTKVTTAYYQGGLGDWFIFNFYLPGVYRSDVFTAKDVADNIREQLASLAFFSFQAPDPSTGADAYYLALIDEQKEENKATVFLMKIGTMSGAVYGVIYGRDFSDMEDAKGSAIAWISQDAETYFSEVGGIAPDKKWLATFK